MKRSGRDDSPSRPLFRCCSGGHRGSPGADGPSPVGVQAHPLARVHAGGHVHGGSPGQPLGSTPSPLPAGRLVATCIGVSPVVRADALSRWGRCLFRRRRERRSAWSWWAPQPLGSRPAPRPARVWVAVGMVSRSPRRWGPRRRRPRRGCWCWSSWLESSSVGVDAGRVAGPHPGVRAHRGLPVTRWGRCGSRRRRGAACSCSSRAPRGLTRRVGRCPRRRRRAPWCAFSSTSSLWRWKMGMAPAHASGHRRSRCAIARDRGGGVSSGAPVPRRRLHEVRTVGTAKGDEGEKRRGRWLGIRLGRTASVPRAMPGARSDGNPCHAEAAEATDDGWVRETVPPPGGFGGGTAASLRAAG
jgi:hypothetical protein